jgi:hypothetical protein
MTVAKGSQQTVAAKPVLNPTLGQQPAEDADHEHTSSSKGKMMRTNHQVSLSQAEISWRVLSARRKGDQRGAGGPDVDLVKVGAALHKVVRRQQGEDEQDKQADGSPRGDDGAGGAG